MKSITVKNLRFADSDLRLDASYHLNDCVLIRHKYLNAPVSITTIKEQAKDLFLGNIFRRIYVSNPVKGVPYLTGSDMIKSEIDSGKFLAKKQAQKLNRLMLKKGWILVSCSGTLGNVVFTNEMFENRIATHDLIRIIPNNKDVKPGFLYAYLASKFGYSLLTQSSYGGVVKHIEPEHIAHIPVPIFSPTKQEEIHDLISQSASLRVEANKELGDTKELFYSQFQIKKLLKEKENAKIVNISDVTNGFQCRIDSISYINNGIRIISELANLGYKFNMLGSLNIKTTRPGIFKRIYVKEGYPYIKGSELGINNPFNNCVYLSKTKTPFLNELKLKENQILFTCAGSVGMVRLITKEFEEKDAIGSQDIIRIESNDIKYTSEYIFAYLKLPFVYDYIQSLKYGSVIERVEPFHVERIPIVEPTEDLLKKVSKKIMSYKNLLYRAFKMEERAIQLIENEIDQWQQ